MPPPADLMAVIARHWNYDTLRPLQEPAMRAFLEGRDSLVVLPTGAGKSLCYQAPAVLLGGTSVVVSPLIALMKDQVDGLRTCGVNAAQLDSSLSASQRNNVEMALRAGMLSMLFVSPERLVQPGFAEFLAGHGVRRVAIDEAHCISHWGHDFRPEYRMLSTLREKLPEASIHAYTATATEPVRRDIVRQLALEDPEVLVGNFDRANLTYRVWPRQNVLGQVNEVLERHPGEAGIVYCMSRKDVDKLAADLREQGVRARPYHAGKTPDERRVAQEEFASEECDVVVATIAFGMGIDRSNVRFVLHAALPKSIEHYQQETGRAGRDGLEAECVLLYSGGDVPRMRGLIEKSAAEADDRSFLPVVLKHLDDMDRFARGAVCRHKALVEYFGQSFAKASCDACDLCLGDAEEVGDAALVAQKILSCVARVKQSFGLGQVLDVLRGKRNEKVLKYGHDKLTTHGLLKEHADPEVRDWIYQLIGQDVLVQTDDEYPKLMLNEASWEVMRGQKPVRLVRMVRGQKRAARGDAISWEGVDHDLFEALRAVRKEIAAEKNVPTYVVFSDATLRELARYRPGSLEAMRRIYGVGEVKLREFGERFLGAIASHCAGRGMSLDALVKPAPPPPPSDSKRPARQDEISGLFRQGLSLEQVMSRSGLARSTLNEYLAAYVRHERPKSISAWVDDETYQRVAEAVRQVGVERLKPIFLALNEKVPYDAIRLVLAHMGPPSAD